MAVLIGWEISTTDPITDADIATLMDFRVDQSRGLHFIYVLPYSDRHLLVESTMISNQLEDKDWYRNAISQWLADRKIEIQSQLREEYGVIPMATAQPQNTQVANIGAAGGSVRLPGGPTEDQDGRQKENSYRVLRGVAKTEWDYPGFARL